MKKMLCILLAVSAMLTLSACGSKNATPVASGMDLSEPTDLPESTAMDLTESLYALTEITDVAGCRFSVPEYFETTETTTYSEILGATMTAATSGKEEDKERAEKLSTLPIHLSYNEGYMYVDVSHGMTLLAVAPYSEAPEDLTEMTEDDFITAFTSYAINQDEAVNVSFNAFTNRTADKASAIMIYNLNGETPILGQVAVIRDAETGDAFVLSAFDSAVYFRSEEIVDSFVCDSSNPGCGITAQN